MQLPELTKGISQKHVKNNRRIGSGFVRQSGNITNKYQTMQLRGLPCETESLHRADPATQWFTAILYIQKPSPLSSQLV